MSKNKVEELRKKIDESGKYSTCVQFNCGKKRERIALERIADEMEENGVGFKEACLNLICNCIDILNTTSDTKERKKRKSIKNKVPVNKTQGESKEISQSKMYIDNNIEIKTIPDDKSNPDKKAGNDNENSQNYLLNNNLSKSTDEIIAEKKRQKEENNNSVSEDEEEKRKKELLRKKLMNSYFSNN